MQCPFCGKADNDVIDSRPSKDKTAVRRRRRCRACEGRFTTFESTPEQMLLLLMKRHAGQGATLENLGTALNLTSRAFRGLSEDMEKLVAKEKEPERAEVPEKAKPEKKRAAKPVAEVKPKKRAPVEKKVAVRKRKKARKAEEMTAAEQVLKIVKRHKKGVDIGKLKTKTGFDDAKVRNIVSRAFKEGKIKRIGRGVYTVA